MKFLLVKREPLSWTDGISQFLFSLADGLLRLGHKVVCVSPYDNKLNTVRQSFDFRHYAEMEVLENHDASVCNPRPAARLWRRHGAALVSRHQPDFILLNGALPSRFSKPSALLVHDLEMRKLFGNLGRRIFKAITYRLVDQLLVTCPELIVPVARDSLCNRKRFRVIPTCIDTQRYSPRPLSERRPVILHVGFASYKAPRATLKAFASMQNKTARLVIVGKVDPTIASEADRLPSEVRARIEMPGMVSAEQLKELLGSSRVMAVPSKYELPVASPTVLETMASHTPCVLSSGISRIVAEPGKNCFVEDSVQGLARRLDELLVDDELWEKLSAGCAETKMKFDSLAIARQYIDLAERMATGGKPPA